MNPTQALLDYTMSELQQVLIVDDEPHVISALRRLLRQLECKVQSCNSAEEALGLLEQNNFDLVLSDIRMPHMSGVELLSHIANYYPETERIAMTGYADMESTIDAINKGQISQYVEKPWDDQKLITLVENTLSLSRLEAQNRELQEVIQHQNAQLKATNKLLYDKVDDQAEDLQKINENLKKNNRKLSNSYRHLIETFVNLLDQRLTENSYNDELQQFVEQIATTIGFDEETPTILQHACHLRNIGMLGFEDKLLNGDTENFSEKQLKQYQQYPAIGATMLAPIPPLQSAVKIIHDHREYLDGTGFPRGLKANNINMASRILCVAVDIFEVKRRSDKLGQNSDAEILSLLNKYRGSRYDAKVVDAVQYLIASDSAQIETTEHTLSVDQLSPGLVLSRNLVSESGQLLLSKGYILDASIISKLSELEKNFNEHFSLHIDSSSKDS